MNRTVAAGAPPRRVSIAGAADRRCHGHRAGAARPCPLSLAVLSIAMQETTMPYVDGFVFAVPTANRQAFLDHAGAFDRAFLDAGATRVVEAWGDDVPEGRLTDFRRAVQAAPGETVVFAWVEWPDKASRDAGNRKVMEDPRMASGAEQMPFDGKRMIFGGFEVVLDLAR